MVSTGRLEVDMESIGLRVVRIVEAPEASEPHFASVTIPQASPSNVRGGSVELGASVRGG
jgi:hypothetical protein